MPKADLTKTATLQTMVRLDSTADTLDSLEATGGGTSDASQFIGRDGYAANFLNGWRIPFPIPIGARAEDRTPLKDGSGFELKYQNFSVVMSKSRRMTLYTAVNIDGSQSRRIGRSDNWRFDGRIDKTLQLGNDLYNNNALDRGHMVRREDPVWGTPEAARIANDDTFHFTNCCPQMAGVNQKTWLGLENYVLEHARADSMRVTVFTGPFFSDDDLQYRDARVPLAFWKVVAIVTDDGRPSATAYKVSQSKELEELEFVFAGYKTYQISVQQVIDDTEIDFSALTPFDGFSQHEAAGNERLVEPIERLETIRI